MTASFYYDADGKQVKAVVDGVTTYYVGNHYIIPLWDEKKGTTVTKYYFAGSTRLAVRTGGTLRFLLGDHLGSFSVTTDANGAKTASALYKAFGETRYTLGNLGTDYKFTGQREEASLGIYFFNARWMDPSLGRFTSPDSIVPTSTQGTQAWDRYAFVNNNPVRYVDLTGHDAVPSELWAEMANDINDLKNDYQSDTIWGEIIGGVFGLAGAEWALLTVPFGVLVGHAVEDKLTQVNTDLSSAFDLMERATTDIEVNQDGIVSEFSEFKMVRNVREVRNVDGQLLYSYEYTELQVYVDGEWDSYQFESEEAVSIFLGVLNDHGVTPCIIDNTPKDETTVQQCD